MEKITVNVIKTSTPTILKFETNKFLTDYESFEFNNIDEADASPLAQQLFYLPFVKKIYISVNFIAIERFNIVEWEDVQEEVAMQIEDYLNNGGIVVEKKQKSNKIPITVYSESTPNPDVMKFVCNKKLVNTNLEYASIEEAKSSPLGTELFNFPFVKSVYFNENYISITKFDVTDWNDITNDLRDFIKGYLENGKRILDDDALETSLQTTKKLELDFDALDETSKRIITILNEHVKPAVASDGGNIAFQSYDEKSKIVKVVLQGACSGCPSSTFTLKNGIEAMLKEMLNDHALTVEAING